MAGVTRIEIAESVSELEALINQQKKARFKERIQALYLIKAQGLNVSRIALILGRHRSTVQRWLSDYRAKGIEGLLEMGISTGRKRVIPEWAQSALEKQLEEPNGEFQRYTQIQCWLETVLGVQAGYATVHHLIRYKLKAKLKVPRLRHQKQDEEKKSTFKKTLETT